MTGMLMLFPGFRLSAVIITSVSLLPFGAPRHDFRACDFARLRWIEGTWQGNGGGTSFVERYRFINDTTVEMESFRDASLHTLTERAVFALRDGHIYEEAGRNRWEATRVTNGVAQFLPVRTAASSFQFTRNTRNSWTAIILDAKTHAKTVYAMKRI